MLPLGKPLRQKIDSNNKIFDNIFCTTFLNWRKLNKHCNTSSTTIYCPSLSLPCVWQNCHQSTKLILTHWTITWALCLCVFLCGCLGCSILRIHPHGYCTQRPSSVCGPTFGSSWRFWLWMYCHRWRSWKASRSCAHTCGCLAFYSAEICSTAL